MKRYLLLLSILYFACNSLYAQTDSIEQRVILIGDAGEIDNQQSSVISTASFKILPGKTTVVYLGDNIYPTGMGLPGSPEEAHTRDIIRAQYQPMRALGAPVYFLPGNHDWDRMGKQGLQKIKAQWSFLDEQNDSLLKLLPPNGCPGPVEVNISDNLVVIIFDSEWWLFPYNKENGEADCDCSTKEESILRFEELAYKNRYKMILLADHHPFKSYGHHGGHYGLKDHLFPFTAINKNLYIPLPVVGSLYPILRKLFANPEDADHPLYRDMIKRIDGAFDTFPNLVHVSGHEHGMQLIKENNFLQVVSGAGAKEAFVKKGKNALFAQTVPGLVTADQLLDHSIRVTYYTKHDGDSLLQPSFTYTKPYTPVKALEQSAIEGTPEDSITIKVHPQYDEVTGIHRTFFGENYRKEWAAPTTFPVIKISDIKGGLTPTQRGGGHQSHSLRLVDKDGKEWVLRSVNKYPQVLLPSSLRETFAGDVVDDAMSAQHPFSALVVPPIADAVQVPHSNPIIGYVAPDKALGIYSKTFAGTVDLLEEREPLGKSDNTEKMMQKLTDDNDNNFDTASFLRARLLDVLLNDWDRHNDQWRFVYHKNDYGGKTYTAVPRDRDQVFYVNQGVLPHASTAPWLLWFMQDFKKVRNINDLFWESRLLNGRLLTGMSYNEWTNTSKQFVSNVTDSVLEAGLQRLPKSAYNIRHEQLLHTLQNRRAALQKQMNTYYNFINKIVDIQSSDKNELIEIGDTTDGGLVVNIHKIDKHGVAQQSLYSKVFDPSVTKEIRLYTGKGDDSVVIHSNNKSIKLRVIGDKGDKSFNINQAPSKTIVYAREKHTLFSGNDAGHIRKHISNDSTNTAFVSTDLYNHTQPLFTAGFNYDDGFILGAGIKYTHKGFRKVPWASVQQITAAHAFSTQAFKIQYKGEWKDAIGKADIIASANAYAPDNTQNFFGRGNETKFIKLGDYKRYYRTRFDLYDANVALKWGTKTSFSIGPSVQYYHFDADDNKGRFILNTTQLNSYDSASLLQDKWHAGVVMNFINDTRDNDIMPTYGSVVNVKLQGFEGLNYVSKAFAQIIPSVSVYRSLNYKRTIVLADRLGGGATLGNTTFYQSLFLDGKENLMGYRQYRFAGKYSIYNNLELRIKLAEFGGYILPGQLGFIGVYDIGRVWEKDEHSEKWHNGIGAGFYFSPAGFVVVRAVASYSTEGWYPYFSFGVRF